MCKKIKRLTIVIIVSVFWSSSGGCGGWWCDYEQYAFTRHPSDWDNPDIRPCQWLNIIEYSLWHWTNLSCIARSRQCLVISTLFDRSHFHLCGLTKLLDNGHFNQCKSFSVNSLDINMLYQHENNIAVASPLFSWSNLMSNETRLWKTLILVKI